MSFSSQKRGGSQQKNPLIDNTNPYLSTYQASFKHPSSKPNSGYESKKSHQQISSPNSDSSNQYKSLYQESFPDYTKYVEEDNSPKFLRSNSYSAEKIEKPSIAQEIYKSTYQDMFLDNTEHIHADDTPKHFNRHHVVDDPRNTLKGEENSNPRSSKQSKAIVGDFNPYQTTYQNSYFDPKDKMKNVPDNYDDLSDRSDQSKSELPRKSRQNRKEEPWWQDNERPKSPIPAEPKKGPSNQKSILPPLEKRPGSFAGSYVTTYQASFKNIESPILSPNVRFPKGGGQINQANNYFLQKKRCPFATDDQWSSFPSTNKQPETIGDSNEKQQRPKMKEEKPPDFHESAENDYPSHRSNASFQKGKIEEDYKSNDFRDLPPNYEEEDDAMPPNNDYPYPEEEIY